MSIQHDNSDSSIIEVKMEVMATLREKYSSGEWKPSPKRSVLYVPIRDWLFAQLVGEYSFKTANAPCQKASNAFAFPLFNPEYAQFLPQPVENEWNKRFREGEVVFPGDGGWRNFNLIWMNYENEDCGCIEEKDEEYFAENVVQNWFAYGMGIRVIASKFSVNHNTREIAFAEERPILLVLHDFYEHPLCLFRILNELHKTHNLIIPYFHDIVYLTSRYNQGNILEIMSDKIEDILSLLIDNYNEDFHRTFGILAHGAACELGIRIASSFKCERLTLLNPIGVIRLKESPNKQESSTHEHSKCIYSRDNEYSLSVESDAGVIIGVLPESSAHENEILCEKSASGITLNYVKRQSFSSKLPSDSMASEAVREVRHQASDDEEVLRRKSFTMQKHKFSNVSPILTKKELLQQEQRPDATSDNVAEIFSEINDCVLDFYERPAIETAVLSIAGIPEMNALLWCQSIFRINEWPLRSARCTFMRYLPGLCVLSGLRLLQDYRNNIEYLDKVFFRAIKYISYWIFEPVTFDEDRATILVSSHGCLLNGEMVKRLLELDEGNAAVECRTVLGSGHDLFETGIEIIKGLV